VSKTIRVYLLVAIVAVIGLYVGFVAMDPSQPVIGIGIAVIAALIGVFLLRQTSSDDDEFFEAPDEADTAPRASAAATDTLATWEPAEGLATWEPSEGLATWEPPEAAEAELEPPEPLEPVGAFAEEEPLDALDLEEIEHIDEFVEAEAEQHAPSFTEVDEVEVEADSGLRSSVIEEIEAVQNDDDILKASHATELSVTAPAAAGGDNSELAKLLAKVQSRLAAYE
jgi:hypothetical protein